MKKFLSLFIALALIATLTGPVQVTAATIKISKTKVSIPVGNSLQLKLTGTTKVPKWKTSNNKIATVNSKGAVKAIAAGTVNITATLSVKYYVCKITVKEKTVVVTVTGMLTFEELTNYIKANKIPSIENKDDFTISYTLTTTQQKEILKLLRDTFNKEYLSESPTYYKSIKANDKFTSFNVRVDANEYNSNKETDLTGLGVFLFSTGYQQFSGISNDKIIFSYTIIDNSTGETIDKIDNSDF